MLFRSAGRKLAAAAASTGPSNKATATRLSFSLQAAVPPPAALRRRSPRWCRTPWSSSPASSTSSTTTTTTRSTTTFARTSSAPSSSSSSSSSAAAAAASTSASASPSYPARRPIHRGSGKRGLRKEIAGVYNNLQDREQTLKSFNHRMMKALTAPLPRGADEIFRLWREMQELKVEPNVLTYNFLIKACFVAYDKYADGFMFYNRMVASGLQPTLVTFNELIKCASKARNVHIAVHYLQEMKKYGFQMDKITAHFVIVTCSRVGDFETADEQLKAMEELGISPTQEMYTYLASGAAHGFPARAVTYLEECLGRGLDVSSRLGESVLNSCIEAGEDDCALKAFHIVNEKCHVSTMGRAAVGPDPIRLDRGTHLALLNLASRRGNVVLGEQAWLSLLKCGYKPVAEHYDALWQAYAAGDDIPGALATLSEAIEWEHANLQKKARRTTKKQKKQKQQARKRAGAAASESEPKLDKAAGDLATSAEAGPRELVLNTPATFERLTDHLLLGGLEAVDAAFKVLTKRLHPSTAIQGGLPGVPSTSAPTASSVDTDNSPNASTNGLEAVARPLVRQVACLAHTATVNSILRAAVLLGAPETVFEACFQSWNRLCDGKPDSTTVEVLLQASEVVGQRPFNEFSEKVLDTLRTNAAWSHIKHTPAIFEAVASAQARSSMLAEADATLKQMQEHGFEPSQALVGLLERRSRQAARARS